MLHLCTYFDHAYLVRALALYESLKRDTPAFTLWALCQSQEAFDAMVQMNLPEVRIIGISELEAFDPELLTCRGSRSKYEYYWTCSPCLPRFLLQTRPEIDAIHYVDSDMYFFGDAQHAVAALGAHSIGITPHRFPKSRAAKMERSGVYNVGWLSFRRDESAVACLEWWRERCIEWCYNRIEAHRFGDQKYLDEFPRRFSGVCSIEHPGVNAAPWNIGMYAVSSNDNVVMVDDAPLIAYHFSNIRRLAPRVYVDNQGVRAALSSSARSLIYRPYLQHLERIERSLAARNLPYSALSSASKLPSLKSRLTRVFNLSFGLLIAAWRGTLITT